MSEDGIWGGESEIKALVDRFHHQFLIYRKVDQTYGMEISMGEKMKVIN
jgi:hypothetical protein